MSGEASAFPTEGDGEIYGSIGPYDLSDMDGGGIEPAPDRPMMPLGELKQLLSTFHQEMAEVSTDDIKKIMFLEQRILSLEIEIRKRILAQENQ